MDWIRERLRELGKSGAEFGRALGVPKARVYEMQKGARKLQPDEIGPAARFLDMTEADVVARLEGRRAPRRDHNVATGGKEPLRRNGNPIAPLVIFKTVPVHKGRQDGFMIFAQQVGECERPEFLRFSERAFAARVLDDANDPVYRRRDLVLVDPDTPPIDGEDCLFTDDPTAITGAFGLLGRLIRSTGTCWYVRQYGAKTDRELTKSAYPNAWPISGRYHRR